MLNVCFNEEVKLIDILGGWPIFDFSQIEIHPFAFEVALEVRAIREFADKPDPEPACMDSIGNISLSTAEYDAYWQLALILFRLNCDARHIMDSDIVRLTH